MERIIITHKHTLEKTRLDSFLVDELKESKNQVGALIKKGMVEINKTPCKKCGYILKSDDLIEILKPTIPPSTPQEKNTDLTIEILYEDEDILILNKPPHLVVHSAPSVKEPTLVEWLKSNGFSLSTLSGEERYGIVHRLDKQTSGAIAIAKNNYAHAKLSEQLKNREMGRYYISVIDLPLKEHTSVECNLGRNQKNRLKISKLTTGGRYSKTDFIKLCNSKIGDLELIAGKLHTGRTHQIRAHLDSISRHIVGDSLYGYKNTQDIRVMLHARLLYLNHPRTDKKIEFEAPIFEDMIGLLEQNFDKEILYEVISKKHILSTFSTIFP